MQYLESFGPGVVILALAYYCRLWRFRDFSSLTGFGVQLDQLVETPGEALLAKRSSGRRGNAETASRPAVDGRGLIEILAAILASLYVYLEMAKYLNEVRDHVVAGRDATLDWYGLQLGTVLVFLLILKLLARERTAPLRLCVLILFVMHLIFFGTDIPKLHPG